MPINPKTCTLTNGRSQPFSFTDAAGTPLVGAAITWTVAAGPGVATGSIDTNGEYTAPAQIAAAATITITGTAPAPNAQTATATVQLVPPEVLLVPAAVDLRAGEVQQFSVTVPGDSADSVQWNFAPGVGGLLNGRYTAPAEIQEDREIQVIAISTVEPHKSTTAVVRLRSKPPKGWITASLFAYLVVVFALAFVLVSLWPPNAPDASAGEKARATRTAADDIAQKAKTAEENATKDLQNFQAQLQSKPGDPDLKKKVDDAQTAKTKATEARTKAEKDAAEALQCQKLAEDPPVHTKCFGDIPREIDLLWLVIVTGALGSFVHGARSFVDFLGNRAFRSSWSAWYIMSPFLGAALALIFYLVVRGGFLSASTTGASVNIYGLVAISGLVGMFAKQATNKLDELFSTLFKTDKGEGLMDKLKTS